MPVAHARPYEPCIEIESTSWPIADIAKVRFRPEAARDLHRLYSRTNNRAVLGSRTITLPLAVEVGEAFNPPHISLLGADAVLLAADCVPHTSEQTWGIREIHGMTERRLLGCRL